MWNTCSVNEPVKVLQGRFLEIFFQGASGGLNKKTLRINEGLRTYIFVVSEVSAVI